MPIFRPKQAQHMDKLLRNAGILALAYLLFNQVYNSIYNRIDFGSTRIKIGRLRPNGVFVKITQPIQNNNKISFPIESIRATVLYGEHPLAEIVLPAPVTIEAAQTTELVFDAFLDFSYLGASVFDMANTGNWLQALRVKGYAVSKGIVIPYEHTISVG